MALQAEKQFAQSPEGKKRLTAKVSGVVDEVTNFEQVLGSENDFEELVADLKGISRINSGGVVMWMRYFNKLQAAHRQVVFTHVSPVLIAQFSLVHGMLSGCWIESFYLPFLNEKTNMNLMALVRSDDLRAMGFQPPAAKDADGSALTFDEIPEEYFACVRRQYLKPKG